MNDIGEGLHNVIHKENLLHRDVNVENIVQSSKTCYKLCDFGSASPVGSPPKTNQEREALKADLDKLMTTSYRAPETFDFDMGPIDERSDVWAFGVVLYRLCFGKTPFETIEAIKKAYYVFPSEPVYSSGLLNLIGMNTYYL